MSTSIAQNIEALCQEQGIDRDLVIEAIKEAVRAAAKKQFKGGEDIQGRLESGNRTGAGGVKGSRGRGRRPVD